MPHPFDAANKHLLHAHPADWLTLGDLPLSGPIEVVDADLSVISTAADKIVRVGGRSPYGVHIEFQGSSDRGLDSRVMVYNVLARHRLGIPVKSLVFLLRPEALNDAVIGRVFDRSGKRHRLEFVYDLRRVWEMPTELLLNGGIGTLPLAPISAVTKPQLPGVVEVMKRRLNREVASQEAGEIWAATGILMGLRWSATLVEELLKGVRNMKESVTYQAIVEEGVKKGISQGRVVEARSGVLRGGTKKFGPPTAKVAARLDAIQSLRRLESLMDRIVEGDVESWDELLSPKA